MPRRAFRLARYAALLLKMGGGRVFMDSVRRQIYSHSTQIWLEKNLEKDRAETPVECKMKYYLRVACRGDMEIVFRQAKLETKESNKWLAYLKWLYEYFSPCGYLASSADNDDPCFIQFTWHPGDEKLVKGDFIVGWFPRLKEGEVLLEGAYTFEKYRGKKLHPAIISEICEIYRKKGFRRIVTPIGKDNVPSLKTTERVGFTQFAEENKRKFLFFNRSKFTRVGC